MANCNSTDCGEIYQAYLSDVPSRWREQIASLMCKVKQDLLDSDATCDKVKACETLTVLSPLTLDEGTLSVSYTDERGVTYARTLDISSLTGDFIENQFTAPQTGDFWINGNARTGNIDVTSGTVPSNGLYSPATNQLSLVSNGAARVNVLSTGEIEFLFNQLLSGTDPAISFSTGLLDGDDYFIQQITNKLVVHSAEVIDLQIDATSGYTADPTAGRGHEWFDMNPIGNTSLMQLFPTGRLEIGMTVPSDTVSAKFRIDSTDSGFLAPRMTTVEGLAIPAPITGLHYFDTTDNEPKWYNGSTYDGIIYNQTANSQVGEFRITGPAYVGNSSGGDAQFGVNQNSIAPPNTVSIKQRASAGVGGNILELYNNISELILNVTGNNIMTLGGMLGMNMFAGDYFGAIRVTPENNASIEKLITLNALLPITKTASTVNVVSISGVLNTVGGFVPTSGNADLVNLYIDPIIEQTGTASGNIYGVRYEPVLTSLLGKSIAFSNVTGDNLLNETSGRTGIGFTAATTLSAKLHIAAGSATAGTAPIKLTAGTNLAVVENGAFEYDGTNLYFTTGGVRRTVTLV